MKLFSVPVVLILAACANVALQKPSIFFADSQAPAFGETYERNITPAYTETTDLLTYRNDRWRIDRIKVPYESGSKAYICFPVKGKASVECLYRDIEDPSDITMQVVVPDYEEL